MTIKQIYENIDKLDNFSKLFTKTYKQICQSSSHFERDAIRVAWDACCDQLDLELLQIFVHVRESFEIVPIDKIDDLKIFTVTFVLSIGTATFYWGRTDYSSSHDNDLLSAIDAHENVRLTKKMIVLGKKRQSITNYVGAQVARIHWNAEQIANRNWISGKVIAEFNAKQNALNELDEEQP